MTHPTHFACNGACTPGASCFDDDDITDAEWVYIETIAEQVMERERSVHGEFVLIDGPAW